MPLIRYEVTLPAQARKYPTAFAPVPAATTSFFSKSRAQGWTVHGQPGTQRIPAPYSDTAVRSGPGSPLPAGSGGSRYAPPCWFPSLYWARQQLAGSIGGVRAGWLVNARQGPAGRPTPSRPAVPTTMQPGMRPRRQRRLGAGQVAMGPNLPKFTNWGSGG